MNHIPPMLFFLNALAGALGGSLIVQSFFSKYPPIFFLGLLIAVATMTWPFWITQL